MPDRPRGRARAAGLLSWSPSGAPSHRRPRPRPCVWLVVPLDARRPSPCPSRDHALHCGGHRDGARSRPRDPGHVGAGGRLCDGDAVRPAGRVSCRPRRSPEKWHPGLSPLLWHRALVDGDGVGAGTGASPRGQAVPRSRGLQPDCLRGGRPSRRQPGCRMGWGRSQGQGPSRPGPQGTWPLALPSAGPERDGTFTQCRAGCRASPSLVLGQPPCHPACPGNWQRAVGSCWMVSPVARPRPSDRLLLCARGRGQRLTGGVTSPHQGVLVTEQAVRVRGTWALREQSWLWLQWLL